MDMISTCYLDFRHARHMVVEIRVNSWNQGHLDTHEKFQNEGRPTCPPSCLVSLSRASQLLVTCCPMRDQSS
jgi:hypothetical protein